MGIRDGTTDTHGAPGEGATERSKAGPGTGGGSGARNEARPVPEQGGRARPATTHGLPLNREGEPAHATKQGLTLIQISEAPETP